MTPPVPLFSYYKFTLGSMFPNTSLFPYITTFGICCIFLNLINVLKASNIQPFEIVAPNEQSNQGLFFSNAHFLTFKKSYENNTWSEYLTFNSLPLGNFHALLSSVYFLKINFKCSIFFRPDMSPICLQRL